MSKHRSATYYRIDQKPDSSLGLVEARMRRLFSPDVSFSSIRKIWPIGYKPLVVPTGPARRGWRCSIDDWSLWLMDMELRTWTDRFSGSGCLSCGSRDLIHSCSDGEGHWWLHLMSKVAGSIRKLALWKDVLIVDCENIDNKPTHGCSQANSNTLPTRLSCSWMNYSMWIDQ